jgi:hypothetical protein
MELLPLYSTIRFCRIWAPLGTLALYFNKCAAPAKLPSWLMLITKEKLCVIVVWEIENETKESEWGKDGNRKN